MDEDSNIIPEHFFVAMLVFSKTTFKSLRKNVFHIQGSEYSQIFLPCTFMTHDSWE